MKKTYTKPEAELFSFYSDEEITSVQTLGENPSDPFNNLNAQMDLVDKGDWD